MLLGIAGSSITKYGITATKELIRLNQQFCLPRFGVLDPGRDKVVALIVSPADKPLRHRLNTIEIEGPIENGSRKLSSSPFQSDVLPAMVGPSKSRPLVNHRKTRNPVNHNLARSAGLQKAACEALSPNWFFE
jgi:hypothetical protein